MIFTIVDDENRQSTKKLTDRFPKSLKMAL